MRWRVIGATITENVTRGPSAFFFGRPLPGRGPPRFSILESIGVLLVLFKVVGPVGTVGDGCGGIVVACLNVAGMVGRTVCGFDFKAEYVPGICAAEPCHVYNRVCEIVLHI